MQAIPPHPINRKATIMSETSTAAVAKSTGNYALTVKVLKNELRNIGSKPGQFRYLQVEYTSSKAGVKTTAATAFGLQTMAKLATLAIGDSAQLIGQFNGPGFRVVSVNDVKVPA